jgi:DNA sulfur modification protein DndB
MAKAMTVIKNVVRRELKSSEGSREYFLGQMSSKDARELTFVPVIRDEATARRRRTYLNESSDGYQRPGVARRMESFANTPAVVLSGRGKWEYSGKDQSLTVLEPAAIIDGQHRLGGFVCSFENNESERMIDFVLINFESIEEEEKIFVDINSTAKSVASGIVAVIGRSADVQVAELLNNHPNSIFKGKFYIAQSRPDTLFNINSIMKEIGTTFSHGAFQIISDDVDFKY